MIVIDAEGQAPFGISAALEMWRTEPREVKTQTGDLFKRLGKGETDPYPTIATPDPHLRTSGSATTTSAAIPPPTITVHRSHGCQSGVRFRRTNAQMTLIALLNTTGLGLGPLLVGVLNDAWADRYGVESIRYLLCVMSAIGMSGGLLFLGCAPTLRGEFVSRPANRSI